MPSFSNKKRLKYVITLENGHFGSSDNNVAIIEGFRSVCNISLAGELQAGTASIQIYGVSQSIMNATTVLAFDVYRPLNNTIQVYAIDGNQESLVFSGNIINAWGDYQAPPDVFLNIQAAANLTNAYISVAPLSFKGAVDVASIFGSLAHAYGYVFENNGVQQIIENEYLPSSPREQMRKLAQDTNVDWGIDNNILWIAPKGAGRGGYIPLISKDTGMIGYPTFDAVGVNIRMIYNPAIRQGGKIQVDTDIVRAKGTFVVASFSHALSSDMPNGEWFTNVRANNVGLVLNQ